MKGNVDGSMDMCQAWKQTTVLKKNFFLNHEMHFYDCILYLWSNLSFALLIHVGKFWSRICYIWSLLDSTLLYSFDMLLNAFADLSGTLMTLDYHHHQRYSPPNLGPVLFSATVSGQN